VLKADTRYTADTFTRQAANELADRIERFWRSKGQLPKVWVEQDGDVFVVRSSMVGGRPQ